MARRGLVTHSGVAGPGDPVRWLLRDTPRKEGMAPAHVLVPLDGSPLAREAFAHALEPFDCQVTVLNVVTPLDADMSEGGLLEPGNDRLAEPRECGKELIERASDEAASQDRAIETAVATGDPAETILEYVDDHAVDHVVVGGHGGEGGELTRSARRCRRPLRRRARTRLRSWRRSSRTRLARDSRCTRRRP